jgi:hypothetical protein
MLVHEVFRPQVMSYGIVPTRSEEEVLDVLMELPKQEKTHRTSLYQISKLSLSLDVEGITDKLKERWSHPVAVPDVGALRLHLQRPLEEQEKIPISKRKFGWLCTPYSEGSRVDELSAEQLSTLFRVSKDEGASEFEDLFKNAINYAPPPTGTEDLFHYTYDNSIGRILQNILSKTTAIRNSNRNTSTALQWPDYGLIVNSHCILRGEEKGSDTSGNPEQELCLKLHRWEYDPLLYILGLL